MKPGIHPDYRPVLFHDTAADRYFKIGSTIKTDRTIDYMGEVLPYVTLDVSSASHVFFTGKQKTFNKESSAARFNQRFGQLVQQRRK